MISSSAHMKGNIYPYSMHLMVQSEKSVRSAFGAVLLSRLKEDKKKTNKRVDSGGGQSPLILGNYLDPDAKLG